MSDEAQKPLFLERATYRRRRMADAARMLPIFGVVLLALPMLWSSGENGAVRTTHVMGYVFGVWVMLAVLGAVLQAYLAPDDRKADAEKDA
ncbi:hypothetical protein [Roseovarius sp. 2305UL8-3]|uniref:hypothetical protein n=1 Tax=Roseovarius conchicola TaxID=3121636 RepID=UPI0035295215